MRISVLDHHDLFQALCQSSVTWFSFGLVSKIGTKRKKRGKKQKGKTKIAI